VTADVSFRGFCQIRVWTTLAVFPPLTFARVRGRAVSRLPRSTCWSLGLSNGPPRDSSSPTATSWTLVPGRAPESFESGSPPHPLRRLRRSGRIRSTCTGFPASVVPLLELLVLLRAPLPGLSGNVHSRSAPVPLRVATARSFAPLRSGDATLPTRSVLVVSTTSTACSVPGLQHVAAGTRSGVRQVGPSPFVGAPSTSRSAVHLGPGSG